MAAPSYTTDLLPIDTCEALGTWVETGTWVAGAAPALEPDIFIQTANSISKYQTTGTAGIGGAVMNYGSGITIPSPGGFFIWVNHQCPNDIDDEANGGLRGIIGSDINNFRGWNLRGKNTYTYGGWTCYVIDPAINSGTPDYTIGSPTSTKQWFGAAAKQLANAKGGMNIDVLRYGRGEARINGGEAANYATFAGFAAQNDSINNRWGLLQVIDSGYLWQGLLTLGYTSAVDFRDYTNALILVANTKKVISSFNKIEIRQTGSRVDWTGINFLSLGTVSKGAFEMIDNADVRLNSCQFTDMNTFIFLSNAQAINCQWLRCNTITAPGILLTNSKVLTPTVAADTSAIIWNAAVNLDGKIDGMTFSKGTNAHHAIELGVSSPNNLTIRNVTFSGFNASDQQNDSVLHLLDKGSNTTWTIGCVGCTGTVSYKKVRSGDAVNITQGVALTVHVQDAITGTAIVGAAVMVKAASGGPKPYQASVSIVQSGGVATVTHNTHGLVSNDYVIIEGCTEGEYNGGWKITKTGENTYTYVLVGSPSSPATGTPVSTFAPIYNITDGSGNISDTRTYTGNQPISGRVRKGTGAPYYKTMPISGTISSSAGLAITVNMISDD